MIVLGVDPGGTIDWCVLDCSPTGAQPGLVAAGSTRDPLEVPWRSYGVALVAVELPEGFYPSAARKGTGGAELASIADNTPYEGMEMPVSVVHTMLRGRWTVRDGKVVGND